MASLTRKILKGRAYYYLRECKWVDGRPKIVRQQYVGPADEVVKRLARRTASGRALPQRVRSHQFGAVAALFGLIAELDLVALIDKHAGSARPRQGLTVGKYLAIAAINRCIGACSKAKIADWYASTVLPRLLPMKASQLTSQRFWDKMDQVSPDAVTAIERELTATIVKKFNLNVSSLFYDATNFFTFIDSFNHRPTMAQRGHCKYGRANLRILGLALLVTRKDQVPLLHHLYPGNQHDAVTFRSLLGEIDARHKLFAQHDEEITVVFDKGNNAQDIIEHLDSISPYHFVGSLVPTQHPKLLEIRRAQMKAMDADRLPGVRSHRTQKEAFGAKRTVLVTFNPALYKAQVKTLTREFTKRLKKLRTIDRRLDRWRRGGGRGKKPSVDSTRKAIRKVLTGRHMKELIPMEVAQGKDSLPTVEYGLDRSAWVRLKRTLLGKTLLFTDQNTWSDEDIIEAYRGQANVEAAFRQMKDTRFVTFRPAHHWTNQKLRVHAFYSVLALTLSALLRKRLRNSGITLSTHNMLAKLQAIREVTLLYSGKTGRPSAQRLIEDRDPLQQRIYTALDLEQYTV